MPAERIATIDFETTGVSPSRGDRATEIAIVMTENGRVVDRFQSLMRTGVPIPAFITALTGITNEMVAAAPPAEQVMAEAARFVGDTPLVAHNAGFDQRFWRDELARAGLPAPQPFACTVLLSRRLYPHAPSHRLGALVEWFGLPCNGRAHRALADAEMAAELLGRIRHDLIVRHGIARPDHAFLRALQDCSRRQLARFMAQHGGRAPVARGVEGGDRDAVGRVTAS
jgi:DNA polymerase-3 subunit epsilon